MRLFVFFMIQNVARWGMVAVFLSGCAPGHLSPSGVVRPNYIRPRLVGADAFGPKEAKTCFQYGDRKGGPSLLPGDRLRMNIWSAGVQDYDPAGYKNTFPPIVRKIDLPLRIVKDGHLDASEQQVLATFLQVNRSPAWKRDSDSRVDRQKLASTLETNEVTVWNAFVGSLCVKAIAPESQSHSVLVVQADIRALCKALPDTKDGDEIDPRQRFARVFLVDSSASKEYQKGCSANPIPREPMTVVGLRGNVALGSWASTALGANAEDGDNYYAQDVALASPKFVQGMIEFNSVAPFRVDSPTWSLKEWEEAEICVGPDRTLLKIKALRLRGSSQAYRITEDNNYTHTIKVKNGQRELDPPSYSLDYWSLPLKALSDLTAEDVDELIWAPSRDEDSPTISPPNCVMRGED